MSDPIGYRLAKALLSRPLRRAYDIDVEGDSRLPDGPVVLVANHRSFMDSIFLALVVDRAVSFHSFGGLILHPYGAMFRPPLDVVEHRRWARHIARRADARYPYRVVQSSHFVPGVTGPGMELDYFHDQHGAISLLIECSRGGLLPPTLRKLVEPFAWYNPQRPDASAPHIAAAVEPFARGMVRPGD